MKIAVLLSGGVDSSVALGLLKEGGHDLTAFYLKVWLEDELDFLGGCPWEEDLEFAQGVCGRMDVPLRVIPLQQAYRDRILSYTLSEIRAGRTPNPDVLCNNRIKFGAFFEVAGREFEATATGHYAHTETRDGLVHLMCAADPIKDQTYFLAHLGQEQLTRAVFPLGSYRKEEVRALAQRFGLPTAQRKDSQGLCFLGKISFRDFVAHHMGQRAGAFIEVETGGRIGEHTGSWFYTIGQRRGLGLSGGPWYVVSKSTEENTVFISRDYHSEDKRRDHFICEDASWILGSAPVGGPCRVKVRHGPESHAALIESLGADRWSVKLDENDQGLAPGQFAVFYQDRECLGCAVISETGESGSPSHQAHSIIGGRPRTSEG